MKSYLYSSLKSLSLILCLLFLAVLIGTPQAKPALAQSAPITAFVHVNVIPMDTERILEDHVVIVEDGLITTVAPFNEVTIPDGAEIIDGQGSYLMPGLADMHTHFTYDPDPRQLRLYVAHGVTTVRNLNGILEHLEWREQVAKGELFGPTIYSGNAIYGVPAFLDSTVLMFRVMVALAPVVLGLLIWLVVWLLAKYTTLIPTFSQIRRFVLPSLGGLLLVGLALVWLKVIPLTSYIQRTYNFVSIPESEAEARQMVRDQATAGVDFIKPYNWMTKDIYFAVADEAEKLGIYTAGHTIDYPEEISIEDMVNAGLDEVAHADEFTHYFWVNYDSHADGWVENKIDMSRIDAFAALIAKLDIAVTPTLITNETVLLGLEDTEGLLQQPIYRLIRPELMEEWRTSGRLVNWQGQQNYRRQTWRPFLVAITKAFQDHGVLLNLGSDVTIEGIVPGYSAHLELPLLVEAGLTPFEALSTGTRNPALTAVRMGREGNFGTVTVGNWADLILLPNNPLEDVSHTQERLGVMLRGQWFTQAELDELVNEFVASY